MNRKKYFNIYLMIISLLILFEFVSLVGILNDFRYLTVSLACLVYFIIALIINLNSIWKNRKGDYEENGKYRYWYKNRLKLIGTSWCSKFATELNQMVQKDKLFFISPSANRGVYEKNIFKELSQLVQVNMVISDRDEIIKETNLNITNENGTSNFISNLKPMEAKELEDHYKNVDVLFDMKGALWHAVDSKDFNSLIEVYHNVLTKDGLLITDCTPETNFNIIKNKFIHFFNKKHSKTEISTLQRLEKKRIKMNFLENKFKLIGCIHSGSVDFIVFQKTIKN